MPLYCLGQRRSGSIPGVASIEHCPKWSFGTTLVSCGIDLFIGIWQIEDSDSVLNDSPIV